MQPKPIKNNYPAIWDLVIKDIEEGSVGEYPNSFPLDVYACALELACVMLVNKYGITNSDDLAKVFKEEANKRNNLGISKYDVPLQPFNGRDAFEDSLEEVLDLVAYSKQALYEENMKGFN